MPPKYSSNKRRVSAKKGRASSRARRRRTPWPLYGLIAILVVAALVGMASVLSKRSATASGEHHACGVVVDLTGSSSAKAMISSYKRVLNQSVDHCAEQRARLTMYSFDTDGAKLESGGRTYDFFPPDRKRAATTAEKEEDGKKVDAEKARAARDAANLFADNSTKNTHGSDVVTAYALAAENMRKSPASARELILLTDGRQASPEFSLGKYFRKPGDSVTPALDHAEKLDLIPQLDGARVYLVGVMRGADNSGQRIPDWQDAIYKKFWTKLTERGGGHLCTYTGEPQRGFLDYDC